MSKAQQIMWNFEEKTYTKNENVTSKLWNVLSELKSGLTSRLKNWTNERKKWTIQSELKKTTHCNSRAFLLKEKGAD